MKNMIWAPAGECRIAQQGLFLCSNGAPICAYAVFMRYLSARLFLPYAKIFTIPKQLLCDLNNKTI